MLEEDKVNLRLPLRRRSGVLRGLSRAAFFFIIAAISLNVCSLAGMILSILMSGFQFSGANALFLIFVLVRGALAIVLYVSLALFFRDLAGNDSPFTLKQAKRLRVAAAMLVADAALGLVSIPGATGFSSVGFMQFSAPTPTFDLRSFALAALLLVISYAFEYGERLQDDSDEIA